MGSSLHPPLPRRKITSQAVVGGEGTPGIQETMRREREDPSRPQRVHQEISPKLTLPPLLRSKCAGLKLPQPLQSGSPIPTPRIPRKPAPTCLLLLPIPPLRHNILHPLGSCGGHIYGQRSAAIRRTLPRRSPASPPGLHYLYFPRFGDDWASSCALDASYLPSATPELEKFMRELELHHYLPNLQSQVSSCSLLPPAT